MEPMKAFDWHHKDIINKAPFDDYDMVVALSKGQFIIEGRQSNIEDAELYARAKPDSEEVWKAMRAVEAGLPAEVMY